LIIFFKTGKTKGRYRTTHGGINVDLNHQNFWGKAK